MKRIAFCHAGSDAFTRNVDRTVPIPYWAPLFALGHTWVSVVKGPREADLVDRPPNVGLVGPELRDLKDTLDVLRSADRIITVDTAIANLAGAYGLKADVLLGVTCDWRWGRQAMTTPWYPSLRLIRQSVQGDWHDVIDQLAATLI